MTRPNIQIDDEVREMTEDEYEKYQQMLEESHSLIGAPTE